VPTAPAPVNQGGAITTTVTVVVYYCGCVFNTAVPIIKMFCVASVCVCVFITVCVCVYKLYCSTYCKAVRVGGGG
jgi:hypothetical protein